MADGHGRPQCRHGLCHEVGLEAVDHDPGSLGHASHRDRPPDTGGAARDENDLAGESHENLCRAHVFHLALRTRSRASGRMVLPEAAE